jgi:putative transposase
MRPKGNQKELERRRKRAVVLLKTCGIRETARRVYSSPSSVVRWRNAFKAKGYKGLTSKKPPSRPCKLTKKQLQKLQDILSRQMKTNRGKTKRMSLKRIAEIIRTHFGIVYRPSGVWYILHRLGWNQGITITKEKQR